MNWRSLGKKYGAQGAQSKTQRRTGTQKFTKFTPANDNEIDNKSQRSILYNNIMSKVRQKSQMLSQNGSFYARNDTTMFDKEKQISNFSKEINQVKKVVKFKKQNQGVIKIVKDLKSVNQNLRQVIKQLNNLIKYLKIDWKKGLQRAFQKLSKIIEEPANLQVSQTINPVIDNLKLIQNQIQQINTQSVFLKNINTLKQQNNMDKSKYQGESNKKYNTKQIVRKGSHKERIGSSSQIQVIQKKQKTISDFKIFSETMSKLKMLVQGND